MSNPPTSQKNVPKGMTELAKWLEERRKNASSKNN